jgi:phage-related protein (TIGR01555 family)
MSKKRKAPAAKPVKTEVSSQIANASTAPATRPEKIVADPVVLRNEAAEAAEKIMNGALSDALGFGGGSFPWNQGVPGTAPVEQVTSIFVNLRYYLISNFRQILNQAYVEFGLVQTIVDVPVDDGLRGGVEIKSKQLDEDEIEKLQSELDRDDDINTAGQAAKWNRLFGGAGILIITDQDPETELDVTAIGPDTPLQFKAVDMWELFWDQQNVEGGLNLEGEQTDFEFYSYYSQNLHKSRVMMLKGMVAPSFIRPRLRGWGFSVVEALVRSINQYLKATNLSYEVLDEFKLDVYKIKNLVSTLLQPNGVTKVRERVALANQQKNYNHAVVMDGEDEFDHKQLSFSGLAEAMDGIRMQVAADMRMPITKLFGTSQSKGFATDQNDMEVYNSMVESQVRSKLKYNIIRMIEIKCQKLFGFIPDDLKVTFKPLRVLSAEQEENVKNGKFARLMQAKSAGEITTFEFREGCNRDSLLSITLDTTGDSLNPDDPDVAALLDGSDEVEQDAREGNLGADKPDAERPQLPKKKTGSSKLPSQRSFAPKLDSEKGAKSSGEKATKNKKVENTLAYEVAAYEADGGAQTFQPGREPFLERLEKDPLWIEALEKAREAGQTSHFAYWWYVRHGGKKI